MNDASSIATNWAAWIGAITGCVALVFNVWKHFRDGPRVSISVGRNMTTYRDTPEGQMRDEITLVTAVNAGNAPTTITHAYIDTGSSFLMGRGKKWFGATWRRVIIVPTPPVFVVPAVIEPGKQWHGQFPEAAVNEVCRGWKYAYFCIKTATKKRPMRQRIHYLDPTAS